MENAFKILANCFQVLLTSMQHHPSTVKVIVKACIGLHNLVRIGYPGLQNQQLERAENMNHDFIPGAWRQGRNLQDTRTIGGNNTSTKKGKKQRNLLKHWALGMSSSLSSSMRSSCAVHTLLMRKTYAHIHWLYAGGAQLIRYS